MLIRNARAEIPGRDAGLRHGLKPCAEHKSRPSLKNNKTSSQQPKARWLKKRRCTVLLALTGLRKAWERQKCTKYKQLRLSTGKAAGLPWPRRICRSRNGGNIHMWESGPWQQGWGLPENSDRQGPEFTAGFPADSGRGTGASCRLPFNRKQRSSDPVRPARR